MPDDSADVDRWTTYATQAAVVAGEVVAELGGIATNASSDISGWITGAYAPTAIDAWIDATLMLEEWDKRLPVPDRLSQCDALLNEMIVETVKIADVFSDMAIEGSTDADLLNQVGADLGAVGGMAEVNAACLEGL